jgi:hypothetical protein
MEHKSHKQGAIMLTGHISSIGDLEVDGETVYLKRPGKTESGISASWNHIPQRFYVFTTNTEFENQHLYKASAVYAKIKHQGNFSAAAKELLKLGYKSSSEKTHGFSRGMTASEFNA